MARWFGFGLVICAAGLGGCLDARSGAVDAAVTDATVADTGGHEDALTGDTTAAVDTASSACVHDGISYPAGATFPAGDGCNTCMCVDGAVVSCSRRACGCARDDAFHPIGESWTEGCLVCACEADEAVRCTAGTDCACGGWDTRLASGGFDAAVDVIALADGVAVFGNSNGTAGIGSSQVWLTKLAWNGATLWEQTYESAAHDGGVALAPRPGGGFALVGVRQGPYPSSYASWLRLSDAAGGFSAETVYSGADWGWDELTAVTPRPGGAPGYALVGHTSSLGVGQSAAWLVLTGADGTQQLSRAYGGAGYDGAMAVAAVGDDRLALAGYLDVPERRRDAWLLIVAADTGEVVLERTYGGAGSDTANAVVVLDGGRLVLAGERDGHQWAAVVNAESGAVEREITATGAASSARAATRLATGGVMLVGSEMVSGVAALRLWALDADGAPAWDRTLPATAGATRAAAVTAMPDGGVVAAGVIGTDARVLRTDALGRTVCD